VTDNNGELIGINFIWFIVNRDGQRYGDFRYGDFQSVVRSYNPIGVYLDPVRIRLAPWEYKSFVSRDMANGLYYFCSIDGMSSKSIKDGLFYFLNDNTALNMGIFKKRCYNGEGSLINIVEIGNFIIDSEKLFWFFKLKDRIYIIKTGFVSFKVYIFDEAVRLLSCRLIDAETLIVILNNYSITFADQLNKCGTEIEYDNILIPRSEYLKKHLF